MKLFIEDGDEKYEFEAAAAYVVMINPKNDAADMTLALIGRTNAREFVKAVARTLNSILGTFAKGDADAKRELWKIFKKEYKSAGFTGTSKVIREKLRPVSDVVHWKQGGDPALE